MWVQLLLAAACGLGDAKEMRNLTPVLWSCRELCLLWSFLLGGVGCSAQRQAGLDSPHSVQTWLVILAGAHHGLEMSGILSVIGCKHPRDGQVQGKCLLPSPTTSSVTRRCASAVMASSPSLQ